MLSPPCQTRHTVSSLCPHPLLHTHRGIRVMSLCPYPPSLSLSLSLSHTHRDITVLSLCLPPPPTHTPHTGTSLCTNTEGHQCRHFAPTPCHTQGDIGVSLLCSHQGQCRHFTVTLPPLTPVTRHTQGDIRVSSLCPHPPPRPTGRLQRSCWHSGDSGAWPGPAPASGC